MIPGELRKWKSVFCFFPNILHNFKICWFIHRKRWFIHIHTMHSDQFSVLEQELLCCGVCCRLCDFSELADEFAAPEKFSVWVEKVICVEPGWMDPAVRLLPQTRLQSLHYCNTLITRVNNHVAASFFFCLFVFRFFQVFLLHDQAVISVSFTPGLMLTEAF